MEERAQPYGLMAEFEEPEALLDATRRAYAAGYRRMDAYSPFPLEGLSEALGARDNLLPLLVLGGGLAGAVGGFAMQYYAMVINYPLNVGGRPLNSWPMFVPIAFETTILVAALAAVVGMFILNGLPQPYHPVFNTPGFELASHSRFFLGIEAADAKFDLDQTRQFLEGLGSSRVSEIAP